MSNNYFPLNDQSESDIVTRVWNMILLAFDQSEIIVRKEKTSSTSSDELNRKRKLSSKEAIDRKISGKRPDAIFLYDGFELGALESAKSNDETGNKYLYDSQIKLPKLLKGMLKKMMTMNQTASSFKAAALITSGLKIKLKTVDNPAGYVCRVKETDFLDFPTAYKLFLKQVKPCIALIRIFRMILENNADLIVSEDSSLDIDMKEDRVELTPYFFASSSVKNAKN